MFAISPRDRRITARVLHGESCARVGRDFGMSQSRVYQITKATVNRLYPYHVIYPLLGLKRLRQLRHGLALACAEE